MSWFWLNVPLEVLFFGAWAGIPLWMVLRHRDWSDEPAAGHCTRVPSPEPVDVGEWAEYLEPGMVMALVDAELPS